MGIPMKAGWITLLVLCATSVARAQELPSGPVTLANGMVVIGADASISLTPQDDTDAWFNYTDYATMRCASSAVGER